MEPARTGRRRHGGRPEICIEVLSGSNTRAEIGEKRGLYLACGAEEFWTCDADGRMRFFSPSGK